MDRDVACRYEVEWVCGHRYDQAAETPPLACPLCGETEIVQGRATPAASDAATARCSECGAVATGSRAPSIKHKPGCGGDSAKAPIPVAAGNAAQPSRIGSQSDEVKILGETAGGYIVNADGWSFESCPSCGTLVGEWLTEDGPDVMLLVECPMCVEASRDEEWWF